MKCLISRTWIQGNENMAVSITNDDFTKIFRQFITDSGIHFRSYDCKPYESIPPSFFMTKEMLRCIVDAANNNQIEPRTVSVIEGKFDAQSKHLQDLRHLLKLPKEAKNA